MDVKNLSKVVSKLLDYGRSPETPVALIRWGTKELEETITGTLADIIDRAAGLKPPVVVVIGEVVSLRDRLHWFADFSSPWKSQDELSPSQRSRRCAGLRSSPRTLATLKQ